MKKLLCSVLSGLMILTLGGCGKEQADMEVPVQQVNEAYKAKETALNEQETHDNKWENAVNEYVNNTPQNLIDNVSISPKHVYYDNGNVVMEAFVNNGYGHNVYNIKVDYLSLYDKNGKVIAESGFGLLDNLTIASGGYAEWKFIFSAEAVKNQDADLSYLFCQARTRNSY